MVRDTNYDLLRFGNKALLVLGPDSTGQRFQGYAPLIPNSNSILLRYQGYAPRILEFFNSYSPKQKCICYTIGYIYFERAILVNFLIFDLALNKVQRQTVFVPTTMVPSAQ